MGLDRVGTLARGAASRRGTRRAGRPGGTGRAACRRGGRACRPGCPGGRTRTAGRRPPSCGRRRAARRGSRAPSASGASSSHIRSSSPSAREDRLDPRRLGHREPAGADRLDDLLERRVAHGRPRVEAVAQTVVGDVAVAVVGVLREDGQHELVDRRAVGLRRSGARTPRAGARGSSRSRRGGGGVQSARGSWPSARSLRTGATPD